MFLDMKASYAFRLLNHIGCLHPLCDSNRPLSKCLDKLAPSLTDTELSVGPKKIFIHRTVFWGGAQLLREPDKQALRTCEAVRTGLSASQTEPF